MRKPRLMIYVPQYRFCVDDNSTGRRNIVLKQITNFSVRPQMLLSYILTTLESQ